MSNSVKQTIRNEYAHNYYPHVSGLPQAHIVGFKCMHPKCLGWDGVYALFEKKTRTLTVECSLCGTKYIASKDGLHIKDRAPRM